MNNRIFTACLFSTLAALALVYAVVARAADPATYFRPLTGATFQLTETSVMSWAGSSINTFTNYVRVVATTDAFIAFANTTGQSTPAYASPTTGIFLAANRPEIFRIGPGGYFAIRASSITPALTRGTIYIQELSQ